MSIAVAKELYGNVEFSGNLYVDDQNDNDWVGLMFDLFFFFVGDQEYKDWVNCSKDYESQKFNFNDEGHL